MTSTVTHPEGPTRQILLLALAELLVMATWFSASAVVPALAVEWSLDQNGRAWLTMAVQVGFVLGAFGSTLFNLADRVPAQRLFALSALLAGLATALIPIAKPGIAGVLALRFLTGVWLAGVYPVGMKIMATWTQKNRGLAIGLLVGALTVGSASPHLITAAGGVSEWEVVLYIASASALAGGALAYLFVREGPYGALSPPFNWREAGVILRERPLFLANLGYLGHMWELYAMWTWLPLFLAGSFAQVGLAPAWASVVTFAAISLGGVGSLLAGRWADRVGRTATTVVAMAVSGACALTTGFLFGHDPLIVTLLVLMWGFAIVADSAQFSAAASELADRAYIGTALTLQTSLGFLLTLFTIRMVPVLTSWWGWGWAFAFLAIGPAAGILAMLRLRSLPSACQLAGGRR